MICVDVRGMEKRKKSILYLVVLLIVWGIVGIVAISNPVLEEPEDLPLDTWSYYSGRPSHEVFLIKNRDAILVVLFIVTVVPDLIFLIFDYRR